MDIKQMKKSPVIKTNISGTECYDLGDKVLVDYKLKSRYGVVRPNAEKIKDKIDAAIEKGARISRYLEISRENIKYNKDDELFGLDEYNHCYVVQEKAKGINFEKLCNQTPLRQVENQKFINNIPSEHFEQLINTFVLVLNMQQTLNPSNLFYDKTDGFTLIDFDKISSHKYNDGLEYNNLIFKELMSLADCTAYKWVDHGQVKNEYMIEKSIALSNELKVKLFNACENVLPNFTKQVRWILRDQQKETLVALKDIDYKISNLKLTKGELHKFDEFYNQIVEHYADKYNKITNKDRITLETKLVKQLQNSTLIGAYLNKDRKFEMNNVYQNRKNAQYELANCMTDDIADMVKSKKTLIK